jgi:hypothetical protein
MKRARDTAKNGGERKIYYFSKEKNALMTLSQSTFGGKQIVLCNSICSK